MPIYEFRCLKCRHMFEILMRLREPNPLCPSCGSEKIQKLISSSVIRPDGIPKGNGGFSGPSCGGGCKK